MTLLQLVTWREGCSSGLPLWWCLVGTLVTASMEIRHTKQCMYCKALESTLMAVTVLSQEATAARCEYCQLVLGAPQETHLANQITHSLLSNASHSGADPQQMQPDEWMSFHSSLWEGRSSTFNLSWGSWHAPWAHWIKNRREGLVSPLLQAWSSLSVESTEHWQWGQLGQSHGLGWGGDTVLFSYSSYLVINHQ